MPIYFLDTSALVKRYIQEPGTGWVQSLFDPARSNRIAVALISGAEVIAAISRRQRSRSIGAADAARLIREFRAAFPIDVEPIQITASLIDLAMDLAERRSLRGYDAVQLAAALTFDSICRGIGLVSSFVCADSELTTAATVEGLSVEDPNTHP